MEFKNEEKAILEREDVQEHIRKYVEEATKPLQEKYEQQLQAKEKQLQEQRLSLMSEEERVKAKLELKQREIDRLEQQFKQTQLDNFVTKTLQHFGLSQQYSEFITGSDELEITQKAQELSRLVSSQQQQRSATLQTSNMRNPFAKETFNLTEQGQLLRDNPELAKQLATQAGYKL